MKMVGFVVFFVLCSIDLLLLTLLIEQLQSAEIEGLSCGQSCSRAGEDKRVSLKGERTRQPFLLSEDHIFSLDPGSKVVIYLKSAYVLTATKGSS